jgi:transcriptional regulator GlxA family with amidase domain
VSFSGGRSVPDLFECQVIREDAEPQTGRSPNNATITRFLEFLRANPKRPLCVLEICAAIGVAERSLRVACQEHLGMGPIRYLTLCRMHQVRHALLCAEVARTTVTCIAMDHGFYELGRFSVAYRTLFCESPSETLRRAAAKNRAVSS